MAAPIVLRRYASSHTGERLGYRVAGGLSMRRAIGLVSLAGILFVTPALAAKRKEPQAVKPTFPGVYNFQAVNAGRDIALSWKWDAPVERPRMDRFGFEVMRGGKVIAFVEDNSFTDRKLPFGIHEYRVRARGETGKGRSQRLDLSEWSEPASATMKVTCTGAPVVELQAEPMKSAYRGSIPSLRIRLKGNVSMPAAGCTLQKLTYLIDTGTGIMHSEPIQADSSGRFDEVVEAIRPGDEPPSGGAIFAVSVTAENEAGPASSNVYNIEIQLQNRYAPR